MRSVSSLVRSIGSVLVLLPAVLVLQSCAGDMPLPDPGIDRIVTQALPKAVVIDGDVLASAGTAEADARRDALLVCNLAASLPPGGQPVDWQNPDTGSTGLIHGMTETRDPAGSTCRNFTALRTSYDGVRNYAGAICRSGDGGWRVARFDQI
jgi:surface antigen